MVVFSTINVTLPRSAYGHKWWWICVLFIWWFVRTPVDANRTVIPVDRFVFFCFKNVLFSDNEYIYKKKFENRNNQILKRIKYVCSLYVQRGVHAWVKDTNGYYSMHNESGLDDRLHHKISLLFFSVHSTTSFSQSGKRKCHVGHLHLNHCDCLSFLFF